MASVEPWTVRDCGFINLLASGEMCEGDTIHDRQHPHDLSMELAADYDRPLRGSLRWQVYANYFSYNFHQKFSHAACLASEAAGVTGRLFNVMALVNLLIKSESEKAALPGVSSKKKKKADRGIAMSRALWLLRGVAFLLSSSVVLSSQANQRSPQAWPDCRSKAMKSLQPSRSKAVNTSS